jgi:hypothetical protein
MTQEKKFTCAINDPYLNDFYSAEVRINKKQPVQAAENDGRIALAHIYIFPISNQLRDIHFPYDPMRSAHNHFILYDLTGNGKYIVRNRYSFREDVRSQCSIWDLGIPFARQVMAALQDLV